MSSNGGMSNLYVALLGPPRIMWMGHPLAISRRQVRALLYYLAAAMEPVVRDHLCFLFWPDSPQRAAHRYLSHLLTHLRRALPDPTLLVVSRHQISLDLRRVKVDLREFLDLVDAHQKEGDETTLQRAAALYRGPFLEGFSLPRQAEYELWMTAERQRWERRYLETLHNLVAHYTAAGRLGEAIRYARVYLSTDNLAEDMHRRLMTLYAAAGHRHAALRQFEMCVAILEGELGVSPLPETRALYEAILRGEPPPLRAPETAGSPPSSLGRDIPLVGREDARAMLARAHEDARAGQGRIVLISGEAGIGKTRLLQDFLRRVSGPVLRSGARPGTQTLPYHPIVQELRALLAGDGERSRVALRRLRQRLQPVWAAEVLRLLPELREKMPDVPPPLPGEPEEVRPRLFEALARTVFALASDKEATVLALDDAHWADHTTLEWIAYLAERVHSRHFLLLIAYRSEEGARVDDLRHHLRRVGEVFEIHLTGLSTQDIRTLLRHLFGPLTNEALLAQHLRRATGGNPFFLLEILRALVESGRFPSQEEIVHLPLPETVRQAVEDRLTRLSPQARQVLEAASLLEDGFTFDLAYLTAGRSEEETARGLEELVARHLLETRENRYTFCHDLIRRAVAEGLNPVRRQLLHRRAARAVAQIQPHAVATLAYHLEEGGEWAQALEMYARAVEQAQAVAAWQEVELYMSRSLALLDFLDPLRTRAAHIHQRGEILAERAHIRFLQGRLQERDRDLADLEALAHACDSDVLRLRAVLARCRYLNLDGRYEEALEVARAGLSLAERLGDTSAQARLLARMGFAHYFQGEYEAAMERLQQALALEQEETAARGEVLSVLSYANFLVADYERALEYRRQALHIRRRLGRLARVAEDLTDMGILYTRLNRLEEAEHYLQEALALSRRIGSRPAESYALNNLGNLHYVRREYHTALDYYRRSLVLQRATGSRRGESSALSNMGMAYLALGDPIQAEVFLRRSLRIDKEIGYESGLAETLSHLARALLAQARVDEATQVAQQALSVARRIKDRYDEVLALRALAEIQEVRGFHRESERLFHMATVLAHEIGLDVSTL